MQPSIGSRFGAYEITAPLGVGGMGEVYKARDTRLKRDVALKVLPAAQVGDTARHAALVREAEALAALAHPHIAQVYEAGVIDDLAFIAMEYVEGVPLNRMVRKGGLPVEAILRYGSEIAAAVAHAHERGVVHRDLKPGNVVVADDGRVKVLDFGLARRGTAALDEVTRSRATLEEAGAIAGTLPYMAPEVLRGEPADAQSDIWSLGVLLYELTAGTWPFAGQTGFALSSSILNDVPAPLPAQAPAGLQGVIYRALAKDRSQRYRHAREVQAALDALRAAPGAPVAMSSAHSRKGVRLSLVGLVLAVAALGAWWALNPRPPVLGQQRLLSTFPGTHRMPTFSPDGRLVAFVDFAAGIPQVWVKTLAGGPPVQVTSGPGGATRPRWSPLDDQILFERPRAGIWTVPSLGGVERRVLDAGTSPHISPDGRSMVYERSGGEIWIAGTDGSGARRVDGVPAQIYNWPMTPAISPDGRYVAVFRAELGPNGDLWVVPTSGGQARRLTFDMCEGGGPAWTSDGRYIVFSSARGGSHTLWRIPASGGDPEPLTTGAGSDLEPALAADGRSLVYTNVRNEWRLRNHDPSSGKTETLLTSRADVLFPAVSPAGDRIAYFGRDDHGDVQVFTVGLDGAGLRTVTQGRGEINTMPRWSFDGRTIFYYQNYPQTKLRSISADGGQPTDVAPFSWERQPWAVPSPDSRRLVYFRQRGDGGDEGTFIRDFSSGDEVKLSVPLRGPRWSRDGRRLLGAWNDQAWICPADAGACRAVAKGDLPVWAPDETQILLLRPRTRTEGGVWSVSLDGSTERKVVDIGPFRVIDVWFDVAPGGQVIWAEFNQGRYELWQANVR